MVLCSLWFPHQEAARRRLEDEHIAAALELAEEGACVCLCVRLGVGSVLRSRFVVLAFAMCLRECSVFANVSSCSDVGFSRRCRRHTCRGPAQSEARNQNHGRAAEITDVLSSGASHATVSDEGRCGD